MKRLDWLDPIQVTLDATRLEARLRWWARRRLRPRWYVELWRELGGTFALLGTLFWPVGVVLGFVFPWLFVLAGVTWLSWFMANRLSRGGAPVVILCGGQLQGALAALLLWAMDWTPGRLPVPAVVIMAELWVGVWILHLVRRGPHLAVRNQLLSLWVQVVLHLALSPVFGPELAWLSLAALLWLLPVSSAWCLVTAGDV